jgi:hypothetical protein
MDSCRKILSLGGALCVLFATAGYAQAPPGTAQVVPPAVAAPGSSPDPIAAVWQEHKYAFQYLGFTSTYSCDGLADRLKLLLTTTGVRGDVKATPGVCASGYGRPDKFASANLTFASLVPASTPGVTGTQGFGAWKSVSIQSLDPRDLKIGDCEVVEQFRDVVLSKMFTVRNVVDNTRCIPYQESGSLIDLRFEVLAPLPGAQVVLPGAPATAPAAAAAPVYIYPNNQQSAAQQAKDRSECSAVATAQSGYNPAQPQGAAGGAQTVYNQALGNCLTSRGYSVR